MRKYMAVLILIALAGATPGQADWIALKSGARIETKGRWAVAGRYVAYYDAKGETHVIAVMTIDYGGTFELNLAAAEGRPLPPPPPPTAKFVIDDSKVKRVSPEEAARLGRARLHADTVEAYAREVRRASEEAEASRQRRSAEEELSKLYDRTRGYLDCSRTYSDSTLRNRCRLLVDINSL